MKARKFELFTGCLGNGITIYNKAVVEYGDYKTIGHIGNHGRIKLYVQPDYIPEKDMEKIKRTAEIRRREFLKWWNSISLLGKYKRLLDEIPLSIFLSDELKEQENLENKVAWLEQQMQKYLEKEGYKLW